MSVNMPWSRDTVAHFRSGLSSFSFIAFVAIDFWLVISLCISSAHACIIFTLYVTVAFCKAGDCTLTCELYIFSYFLCNCSLQPLHGKRAVLSSMISKLWNFCSTQSKCAYDRCSHVWFCINEKSLCLERQLSRW